MSPTLAPKNRPSRASLFPTPRLLARRVTIAEGLLIVSVWLIVLARVAAS